MKPLLSNGLGEDSPLLLTMNFQDASMMLNEGILDALGRPDQVQIYLNEEKKGLLLMPCEVDSAQAFVMPPGPALQVEIGGRSLLKKICRLTGWPAGPARICVGKALPEYSAVVFDLANSIAVDIKKDSTEPPGGGTT